VNHDLEKLISLHDIDVMINDLRHADIREQEESMGLSAEYASEELSRIRAELVAGITKKWLGLYEQLAGHYGNAVVPAVRDRCCGCLTRLPTAMCSDPGRNEDIHTCPTCGRIIYWAD
jgi:predicted  nucleic acid-binding Zn-ribbon protein